MTKRIAGLGIRKEKEMYVRYMRKHSDTRQKGRKLKRLRASLYAKMDMRLARLRSGLNEYILDVVRLRLPTVRFSVPVCPMMRYK
jgi:hypothetical protein